MKENLQSISASAPQLNESIIGLDLGDRWSRYCVLDRNGDRQRRPRPNEHGGAGTAIPPGHSNTDGDGGGKPFAVGEPPLAELRP